MSAPEKPAPLTPADITALLGDGWLYEVTDERHLWYQPGQRTRVTLLRGRVRAFDRDGQWRSVPAGSGTEVRAVLAFAGLIPGQVSVTQPRVWNEGDPEPTDVKSVVDSEGDQWDRKGPVWVHFFRGHLPNYMPWDELASARGRLTEVVDR